VWHAVYSFSGISHHPVYLFINLVPIQVYDYNTSQPVKIPKSYGYSLKPSELPEAISRFFPSAPVSAPEGDDTPPAASQGIPHRLLLPVLIGIRDDIVALRNAFEQVHLRMVGASILIVYEADWERVEEGLKALEEMERERGESESEGRIEDEGDEDISGFNDNGNEDEDDGPDDDDSSDGPGPSFVVKLIDFAHTRIAPGQGPDQGVLLGLDTLIRLLDGRIEQVRHASPAL
jgi:1D-myo-inositol-tetrakisphosphate 5-kinase/inositol-polyphosphate multikinase